MAVGEQLMKGIMLNDTKLQGTCQLYKPFARKWSAPRFQFFGKTMSLEMLNIYVSKLYIFINIGTNLLIQKLPIIIYVSYVIIRCPTSYHMPISVA